MNKLVIASAQYKMLDQYTYVLTIKAKNERNNLVYNGSQKCKFTRGSASLPMDKKEKLVKKNIRNILYHAKCLTAGTPLKATLTRYGNVPEPVCRPEQPVLFVGLTTQKEQNNIRNQRIWQVVLLNGNPTIVRAENPRLSANAAKELLLKKISGEE